MRQGSCKPMYYVQSFLLFLLLLTACSTGEPIHEEHSLPIEIGETTQGNVPIYIEAIGNVYSLKTVDVRPQVGGIITDVYVKQGQSVEEGQLLYTIDPRPFQATLDQAKATLAKDEAALKLAEITVERYADLVEKNYVSQLSFEQYKSQVEINQAQIFIDQALVDQAEINLGFASIHSPMDGLVGQYHIDVGNVVMANDSKALIRILQVSPADIRFAITQSEFVQVRRAQREGSFKFEAYLPDYPDEARSGTIYFFDNHIDTNTGTILLKGAIPNDDSFFWPGEFVNVRLQLRVEKDAILIPLEALQIGQDGQFVYIFDPGTSTVEYRSISTGPVYGDRVMIIKGVALGEKVVTNGQINLQPGAKVFIKEEINGS